MNRNAIISLAMLYALWQSNGQDLLDLIRPFIVYAIGATTSVGFPIDTTSICRYMESEFGYNSFQPAVVEQVLRREAERKKKVGQQRIVRRNKEYILTVSLSDETEAFSQKRLKSKEHSDHVTNALASFLNENYKNRTGEFSQESAERILLSFFERQGSNIVLSVDNLRQLPAKRNEIDYYVAKFILQENDKHSAIMEYLIELVKGYFVTTAIYMQAENQNITKASFQDVTFYLDTRILLALLGYKSDKENESVQKMVHSLLSSGAKLACFPYNIQEVRNILEAYKQSIISQVKRPSTFTLEYFDAHGRSYAIVDFAQKHFEQRLKDSKVICLPPDTVRKLNNVEDEIAGLLDDQEIEKNLQAHYPTYNSSSLSDDLLAINTVSRIREGKKYPYIERCKAVFATSNTLLVRATKEYLIESKQDFGFPIAITDEELCVLAWLKSFEQSNTLPKMRLLENVLAAITPTQELMNSYFDFIENLENQGDFSDDEASLLRVDLYARNELMELTGGDKKNLNEDIVRTIRDRMREDSIAEGERRAKKEFDSQLSQRKNAVCKQAEDEVECEYAKKDARQLAIIKFISLFIAALFVGASVHLWQTQVHMVAKTSLTIVSIITTIEGVCPFFSRDNFLIRMIRKRMEAKKLAEIDKRKSHYLSLLGDKDTV